MARPESRGFRPAFYLPTFLVDPPTMLLAGAAFAWAGAKLVEPRLPEGSRLRRGFVPGLCVLFQLGFWTIGALCYFDHPWFAAQGLGNDFMWNGYIRALGWSPVPTDPPTYHSPVWNALAVLGWLVQPFFLYWGARLGYLLAGRAPSEKGAASAH